MATWELTIDNRLNSIPAYIMEHDVLGQVSTPNDLWILIEEIGRENNALAKRLYNSLMFQSADFPPVCKTIPAGEVANLYVSEGTTALQWWTFNSGTWTSQTNITKGVEDRAIIPLPALKVGKK